MLVLVAIGSRHGSTQGIGERVAAGLRAAGHTFDVQDAAQVRSVALNDAVILGSAVYMGRWTPGSRDFVARFAAELVEKPVWIFSSGPLGNPPGPVEVPSDHATTSEALAVRGDRIFAGRLVPAQLGFGERLVARAVHAPAGDYRD
jgi:menaquinone-dependent protoporphyrinogen oxidase